MKQRHFFLLFIIVVFLTPSFAQINRLKFDGANCTYFKHGVSSVSVFDQRPGKEEIMGWMKVRNTAVPIVAKHTLKKSLEQYFIGLSKGLTPDSGAGLLLIVHRFYLSERDFSDKTSFNYTADYFTRLPDNRYLLLGSVDTVIRSKAAHLKSESLKSVDNCLCLFYEQLFQKQIDSTAIFTEDDARNYLNKKQAKIPAYGTDILPEGVYQDWSDFLQLRKKENEHSLRKGNKIKVVHAHEKKASFESGFAQVHVVEGIAYYNLDGLLYPMDKVDNNFFITARIKNLKPDLILLFGPLGALAQGLQKGDPIVFLIDQKTGRLIKVKDTDKLPVEPLKVDI